LLLSGSVPSSGVLYCGADLSVAISGKRGGLTSYRGGIAPVLITNDTSSVTAVLGGYVVGSRTWFLGWFTRLLRLSGVTGVPGISSLVRLVGLVNVRHLKICRAKRPSSVGWCSSQRVSGQGQCRGLIGCAGISGQDFVRGELLALLVDIWTITLDWVVGVTIGGVAFFS